MISQTIAIIALLAVQKGGQSPASVKKPALSLELRGETVWCYGVGLLEVALKNISKAPVRIDDPFDGDSKNRRWNTFSLFFSQPGTHDSKGGGVEHYGRVGVASPHHSESESLAVPPGGALSAFLLIENAPMDVGILELRVELPLRLISTSGSKSDLRIKARGSVRVTHDRKGCVVASAV
jgi:hypothetical protein